MNSGKSILNLAGHTQIIESISVSPNGEKLITGSLDGAKIWDLETGKEIITLEEYTSVFSVAFSPEGKRVATGTFDKVARIWDLKDNKEIFTYQDNFYSIHNVAFSPNGKKLALGINNTIKLWDLEAEKESITFKEQSVPSIESRPRLTCDSCFTWGDITSSEYYIVVFSPDGKKLATTGKEKINIWNLNTCENLLILNGDSGYKTSIAFSPDSKKIGAGSYERAVIWDLEGGKELFRFEGHTNSINDIAFSPDGKTVATASNDKTVKIWDLGSGKNLFTLIGHKGSVENLAFSPNSKTLASCSADSTVRIWALNLGIEILTISNQPDVSCVAFSPDGKELALGFKYAGINILNLKSKKVIFSFGRQPSNVAHIVFSPNGKRLAACPGYNFWVNKKVNIWDLDKEKEVLSINGHSDCVLTVDFSSDGQRLATGSYDGTAKIWELTPDALILKITKNRRVAELTLPQLEAYNLENLLDLHPDNESKLLATGEVWQIAAFADLYANKIKQTGFPKKENYERALRLYDYCIKSGEAPEYFEQRVIELKKVWEKAQ